MRNRRGRLQREPDFTGATLTRFREVLTRHGLPVAGLAVVLLMLPDLRDIGAATLAGARSDPTGYAATSGIIGCALLAFIRWRQGKLDVGAAAWVVYLLGLSIWEEWVFRIAIPYGLGLDGGAGLAMIIASNVAFGALHYFTLRWQWQWCAFAAIGGLALSHQFHQHFDLPQLVLLHWIGTTLNTPNPPGRAGS